MFPFVLLWVFSVVNIWKVSGKAINVPLKKFQLKRPISNKEVVTDRSSFERVQTIASGLEKKEKINTNIKDFNKVLPHSSKDRPNFVPPLTNLHQKQLFSKRGISPTDSRKTVNIQRESNAEAIAKSRFLDDSDINRKDHQQRKYFDVRSTRDRKLNNLVSERNEMFSRLPQVSKPPPRPFYQSYHSSKKKTNSASTSRTGPRSPLDFFDPTVALTSSLSDVYSSTVNRASTLFNEFMSPAGYGGSSNRDSSGSILQSTHSIFYDPVTESRVHRNRSQPLRNDSPIHFNMSAVSWNLAELSPTPKDCSFLHDLRHDDFILLGVQECEAVKPRREEGRRSRKWRQLMQNTLSSTHNCLAEHKFGGMQLAVHCHKRLRGLLKKVQAVEVACGLGNVLGNKGAIAVLVKLRNDKTLCFINCHLAAHEKMVQQRNKDYKRIVTQILAQAHPDFLPATTTAAASADVSSGNNDDDIHRTDNRSVKKSGGKAVKKMLNKRQRFSKGVLSDQQASPRIKPLNETFHGVVFMGDFNYRLDVPRLEVNRLHDRYNKLRKMTANSTNATASNSAIVKQDMRYAKDVDTSSPAFRAFSDQLECLLDLDQLSAERRRGRVFKGFQEGEISFPPTYKYDKRSNLFDTSSKARCPAWTDRILYSFRLKDSAATAASVDEKTPVLKLKDYYTLDVRTSDHRPVVAHFDVNL